jgi:hypothetical protein
MKQIETGDRQEQLEIDRKDRNRQKQSEEDWERKKKQLTGRHRPKEIEK